MTAGVDWIEALVLGILQGLTEWLPVSSSGHLALAQRYLGAVPVFIDIMLHLGTMIVLFAFFRKDVRIASRSALAALSDLAKGKGWEASVSSNPQRQMAFCIVLALLPTAAIALCIRIGFGPGIMENLAIVAAGFAVTGVLLLATASRGGKKDTAFEGRGLDRLNASDGIMVGAAQGIAFLPGFSRSGLTISTGLLGGMNAEAAGKYSFLIMLPAVLGAAILSVPDATAIPMNDILMGLAGTAVAMVVGYASLGALMHILKKGKIAWFSPYCIAMFALTVTILYGVI